MSAYHERPRMNATFKTGSGVVYLVCVPEPDPVKPGSVTKPRRVHLTVTSGHVSLPAPLSRSEARAIASALMGAAAEL